jgi:hypothetical protein
VNIDESEKVQISLGGLASKFGAFRTAVCTREATLSFFDLQSILLVEENHVGATAMNAHTNNKMLYTEGQRPRGHGGRNESVSHGGNRQTRHQRDAGSNPRPSGGRGSRGETAPDCWYYGKKGHWESECWKKRAEPGRTVSGTGQTNRRNRQQLHYAEGSKKAARASAFVMRHGANSVKRNVPSSDEVWYLDSGASNHMTRHKEWFSYLEKPKNPGVVSTGDDTSHPITNVGEVPWCLGCVTSTCRA